MRVHDYEKLLVWQKSMDLVSKVYVVTKKFPKEEIYGLTSQIRRATVSIPSNIAEGSRRSSEKDFRNFLFNAFGSASELETQLRIAMNINYLNKEEGGQLLAQTNEILRMLNGLIGSKD